MLLLEIPDIRSIVDRTGLKEFYLRLCRYLTDDFSNWNDFQKSSRHAVYVPNGVIELMPICNNELYSFKYVNGHPYNPQTNKLNVVAFGVLADVASGYPLLISSMTLLTALRTAATSALASRHLAKKESKRLAIIGCGAQSEFQVLAHHALFDLTEVRYFDIEVAAMTRFAHNLHNESFKLMPMKTVREAIDGADIIITATAAKGKCHVLEWSWLTPGQHISGIGGDSPGKTELDPEILKHSRVVVEYFPQTHHEGEIQNLGEKACDFVYAELWEIVSGVKPGRRDSTLISVFDSVGFALEDFSVLRLCFQLASDYNLGKEINIIPETLADCKNLYSLLTDEIR
ncbi:MAG: ornithine cyclodeaminase [Legionellales bacterium RIFCSPHIGHO2_12_FULL_42_9]|nr:MAG: ornithine cyclodeaminase [Legionellales bacterium RIFCSPHIGHO2_12_FULL_42_9]